MLGVQKVLGVQRAPKCLAYRRCLACSGRLRAWCRHCWHSHSSRSAQQPSPVGPGPCALPVPRSPRPDPPCSPHSLCHPEQHPDSSSPWAPAQSRAGFTSLIKRLQGEWSQLLEGSHKRRHRGWGRDPKQPVIPAWLTCFNYVRAHPPGQV